MSRDFVPGNPRGACRVDVPGSVPEPRSHISVSRGTSPLMLEIVLSSSTIVSIANQVANLLLGAYPGGWLVACLVPRYFPDGPFVSLGSGCRRCACRCHGVYLCRRLWSAYYPRGRILPAGLVSWRCTWRPISVPSVLRHCRWSCGVIVVILCIVRGVPCSNCACCGVGM